MTYFKILITVVCMMVSMMGAVVWARFLKTFSTVTHKIKPYIKQMTLQTHNHVPLLQNA